MTHHLFVLSKEIFHAVSFKEVGETAKAMNDAGIFKPPFDKFDIMIDASTCEAQKFVLPEWSPTQGDGSDELFPIILRYEMDENGYYPFVCSRHDRSRSFKSLDQTIILSEKLDGVEFSKKIQESLESTFSYMFATLIVLLATKNISKHTNELKAKRLISHSRKKASSYRYSSITTLNIGKITETMHGDGESRGPVRPHLRRGHIRNQRIGEGRKETKQIFIQPVFVNADEKWIENQRQEYRVKI